MSYQDEWKSLSGDQRARIIDRLYERDNATCHICRQPVTRDEASADHILPASRGGATTEANLALAHKRCNFSRGNRPIQSSATFPVHNGMEFFIND